MSKETTQRQDLNPKSAALTTRPARLLNKARERSLEVEQNSFQHFPLLFCHGTI